MGTISVWLISVSPALAQQTGSGMKGYWRGDDGATPTTAVDLSGNGYNGTYGSGATTSTSVPTLQFPNPTSMLFNNGSAYVDIPTFSFDGRGPITVAFWNYVATADVHTSSAFTIGNQEQPNRCHAHAPWSDKQIYWDYGNANDNSGRVHTDYTPYLDKWTHVVLVSTGPGGGFQGIYLDGVLKVQSTTPTGPAVTFTGATLGAWRGDGLYHKSGLDDFRIYDRVLSQQEVTDLAAGKQGPAAPTGLTAVPGTGSGQISLTWNAVAGARCYNVKRATVAGGSPAGTYTSIASSLTTPTFLDAGLTPGTTYYYVVSAVTYGEGPNSNEASCQPNPISITPLTITVAEGGTAGVTVTLLAPLSPGETVDIPISTDNAAAGLVSVGAAVPAASTTLHFTGPATVQSFIVTGISDHVANLPRSFHIKFGTVVSTVNVYSGINYLPDVSCNETDTDTPGVIVSPVSAIAVNGGPPVTFDVQLATIPQYPVRIGLGISITPGGVAQATVAGPGGLSYLDFTSADWNMPHTVTVTPLLIDTTNTYVGPYFITLSPITTLDGNYSGVTLSPVLIDQATSIPPLKETWGKGCGLVGLEVLVLLAAAGLRRRRRT